MQSRPPERFEDLPAHLQDELSRAPAKQTDTRRTRLRATRALGYAIAAAVLVFFPGAWLMSLVVAPMAILNAGLAIRDARGVSELAVERGWALAGLAVSVAVLLAILFHVVRLAQALKEVERLLA